MNSESSSVTAFVTLLVAIVLTTACGSEQPLPPPTPGVLTRDDTGYFCGMIVEDHEGPKSQAMLQGREQALWFTTARDGLAFLRLPEETRQVLALYVSSIDRGGWDHPERDSASWVAAQDAWFVIGSRRLGSMGAPETIPFSTQAAATAYAGEFGGRAVQLDDIPDQYLLNHGQSEPGLHAGHSAM